MLRFIAKKDYLSIILYLLTQGHNGIDEKFLGEITVTDEVGCVASVSYHLCILLLSTFLNATVCFFET